MDDQTAIDVCERDKYSGDHREHRDGDGYTPKESPIEHAATLASPDGQRNRHHLVPSSCLGGGPILFSRGWRPVSSCLAPK